MSRIGEKPVPIPSGVKVELKDHRVVIRGPQGTLQYECPSSIQVALDGAGQIVVRRTDDARQSRALHGLARALIANMVTGVHQGFERRLEIHGVGYNCKLQGKKLLLNVGYMGRSNGPAQFVIPIPEGLEVTVLAATNPGRLSVRGPDKQLVGQFAAEVRKIRPPEPYKGKGIRYEGEQIRRKQGKAFGSGG